MTVWVVSWEYDGGGGFDWFYNQADAEAALEKEKGDPTWDTVSLYPFHTEAVDPKSVTQEIDSMDWAELHDKNIVHRRNSGNSDPQRQ